MTGRCACLLSRCLEGAQYARTKRLLAHLSSLAKADTKIQITHLTLSEYPILNWIPMCDLLVTAECKSIAAANCFLQQTVNAASTHPAIAQH